MNRYNDAKRTTFDKDKPVDRCRMVAGLTGDNRACPGFPAVADASGIPDARLCIMVLLCGAVSRLKQLYAVS